MRRLLVIGLALVVLGAIATLILARPRNLPQQRLHRALKKAEAEAQSMSAPGQGKVLLLYYRQDDSRRARAFEVEVLSRLKEEFRGRLEVISSAGWPALPSPTVIIKSRHQLQIEYLDLSYETLQPLIAGELRQS